MTIYLVYTSPLIRDHDTRLNLEWLETRVCAVLAAGLGEVSGGFSLQFCQLINVGGVVSGVSVITIQLSLCDGDGCSCHLAS